MKDFVGLICALVISLGVLGLTYATSTTETKEPNIVYLTAQDSTELTAVKTEFGKIESKDDKLVIYKLFAGAGEYLAVSKFSGSTAQFDPLMGKVQTSYNWNREKYPAFTTAVSNYLVSVKYDEPKIITSDSERLEFAKIFQNLAKAIE